MFYKTLTLLALLLIFTHSEVVVLDDSNYTSFIQQHSIVFVKFYAPWCGHCKSMAPDYIKLAEAAQGKDYVIAQVDATIAEKTASDIGVQGYPSIKLIVSGTPIDYDGARTTEAMQTWIQKMISSEVKQITEDQLKELIGTVNLVVVQGASKDQLKNLAFAQQNGDTPYYAVEGGDFKVTLYLKNSKTIEYSGEITIKDLSDWVVQQTLGHLVALSSQSVVKKIFENQAHLPVFLLLKNSDFTEQVFETLRSFCEAHEKELLCAYAEQSHQVYRGIARFFKFEENEQSLLAYFDYGIKNGYFVDNATQITHESLSQFLVDVSQGKVEKFHDQEKAKEQKQIKYTNVVKLNNQTYQSTLNDNKYVFVEYYSATCGHCVKFAPEYQELATKLKEENSEFVIAAVDVSQETEIGQIAKVSGYPTFRFYINGHELDYNGPRDAGSMANFMSKVSKSQLKTVNSVQDLQKPAIAVYGIDENSPFHLLQHVYTRFPVYQVLGESQFKVQIHEKKFAAYSGEKDLKAVANWLDENTEQVIVNVVEANPAKKLSKALEEQTPLLVIINRDNSEAFKTAYILFQNYCPEQKEFICGIANKHDEEYESFNSWLNAGDQVSGIVYLNTEKFQKFLYPGDLASVSTDSLNSFVSDIKEGKVSPYTGEPDSDIAIDLTKEQQKTAQTEATPQPETETISEKVVENEDL